MNIDALRLRASYVIAAVALAMCLASVATELLLQGGVGLAGMLAGGAMLVLFVTGLAARNSAAFRLTAVSVMMAEVVALLIAARGNPIQIDLHMAFFAGLALCALLYDIRAILLGTVLVAVHHLGLGLAMETLVFYGGGSLGRVILHAVLLVTEAAGLVALTLITQKLLNLAESKSAEAALEAEKVSQLAGAAGAERQASDEGRRQMLARLDTSFGHVVKRAAAGDFSQRVVADFDEPVLSGLAGNVNALVDTVERGLEETGAVLGALARTDLTQRVSGRYDGAFGRLKDDTNAVADTLARIVGQLRQTSEQLRTATGEILSGANDLSERTTRQAATIEQTSAAMEQLATTVIDNARRAEEASRKAEQVSHSAEAGGSVMAEANGAMERITTSSGKISSIIGLIDDIAFQTNLLALNASVEAARAGDAGKGFAVVAVEVRRLAQSAASASRDVKALIEQSAHEVSSGSRLVADAAGKLTAMLESVRENSTLLGSIARASREQASAIEEVSTAVRQMDEMTQHNAALVEETNAAIEQTEAQASDLDRIVEQFALTETGRPRRAA